MKRKIVPRSLIVMSVLLMIVAGPLLARKEQAVPFKGSIKGILTRQALNEPATNWSIEVDATGTASHLGRVEAAITFGNVGLAPSQDNLVPVAEEGVGTLTPANGDQVTASYRWLAVPTATLGVLSIVGTYTITGGTGRFAGASGFGIWQGQGNVFTNEVTASFDGFITLRHPKNR